MELATDMMDEQVEKRALGMWGASCCLMLDGAWCLLACLLLCHAMSVLSLCCHAGNARSRSRSRSSITSGQGKARQAACQKHQQH